MVKVLVFQPSQLQRLTWWTRHSEEPRLDIDDWLASQSTGSDDNTSDAASTEKEKGVEMENLAKSNGKGKISGWQLKLDWNGRHMSGPLVFEKRKQNWMIFHDPCVLIISLNYWSILVT